MRSGAGGVRVAALRTSNDAALIACVTQVSDKFLAMSYAVVGLSAERVEDFVSEEVRKAVKESMTELESLLEAQLR